MDIRPGTTLQGPDGKMITIETFLGRGGFGQVFAGRLPDSVRVAVKTVLTAPLSEDELHSLQNEAKLAMGIVHPNVVRVLHVSDGETTPGRPPYLVMEYVDGGTLRAVLEHHEAKRTKIGVDELRAMYLQIAEGMGAVNARVVHRDLKPDNVLVDAAGGRLKIADFGLAKLVGAATRSATFKGAGTRPYQAPEAFEEGPNTPAMDVYAAGVMFYELATLDWPVQPKPGDASPMAWRNAHLLSAPKDLRMLRPDLPIELVQLIMRMLQKNPVKRPASWNEIIEWLKPGRSISGSPDVSALVNRATSTFIQATEAEVRARQERERMQERTALLEQAFSEPAETLRTLVEAYNNATSVGKLGLRSVGPLRMEVSTQSDRHRLVLEGQIIDDLNVPYEGMARLIAIARLHPPPHPYDNPQRRPDPNSFGGFNLVYHVPKATERFGEWIQYRFEMNPLTGHSAYPRWFAVELPDLPRELQVLNALGMHQHQHRHLDDVWFKELLAQML